MDRGLSRASKKSHLSTMLRVDARRMFLTPLFYIFLGIAIAVPILILVMTTMMDGSVSVDPQTGKETVMEGFKNTWQIIGSLSSSDSSPNEGAAISMDLVTMCNINLLYFGIAVYVCLFIAEDFRSGYAKNLFAIHSKKSDYIISKILICSLCGAILLITFFIGAMIGGAVSGLSFEMVGFNATNLSLCMISKMLLMVVFVSIFVTMAVIAKQSSWLSMLLSLGVGMLLFMMIPSLTPLNAEPINTVLCLAGGALFALGLGSVGTLLLRKRDIL